jgi:hypothetical protein
MEVDVLSGTEDVAVSYERQVLFNAKLEQIAIIETADKAYVEPLDYVKSNEFKPPASISSVEDCMPFLELVIFIESPNVPRYRVSFDSYQDLDHKFWKKIEETVIHALNQFKIDRRPDGSWENLFLPSDLDDARTSGKINEMAHDARRVRDMYARFKAEIEQMANSGVLPEKIASQYGLDEDEVRSNLYAEDRRNRKYAELAKEATLAEMRKIGLSKKYGIYEAEKLDHLILHRLPGKEFHKVKRKDVISHKPLPPAGHVIPD